MRPQLARQLSWSLASLASFAHVAAPGRHAAAGMLVRRRDMRALPHLSYGATLRADRRAGQHR